MAENATKSAEDAEMSDCNGEKVVTMMDVLQEQQDFEDDANAVLGASDDKNCTYSKGYVKRQAVYACLTCCPEASSNPDKRAGVCLACSLACHENHELVELYTKRNFRCDCGNPKFTQPCQFTPNKSDLNYENKYNQNFSGLYCICKRPYPDPEATEEEEMIQCIICEDWLHTNHLEATVPNIPYAEMICKECMDDYGFLHDYSDLVVNVADKEIVVVDPDLDFDVKDQPKKDSQKENLTNGHKESKENKEDDAESVLNSIDSIVGENKNEDKETNEDKDMKETKPAENNDQTIKEPEQEINNIEKLEDENKIEAPSEPVTDEIIEADNPKCDNKVEATNAETVTNNTNEIESEKIGDSEAPTEQAGDTEKSDNQNEQNNEEPKQPSIPEEIKTTITENQDENPQIEPTEQEVIKENGKTECESDKQEESTDAQEEKKDQAEKKEEMSDHVPESSENIQGTSPKTENKRKLSTSDDMENRSPKKAKIEEPCLRPKGVKRVYKGATFWPNNFRQKLCTCGECISMYKDLAVMYLIDLEDTVTAYEALGKENSDGTPSSQYEKGLQALSSLDRVQQINALTEYNKMRDKLLDFLKSFKDRKEIVKEEDIKAFFAGMKPKREPDGVYFCR